MLFISSIYLNKFKRFKVSNIKEFKLNIANKIQCIIGTNGSGKSSLLEQLKLTVPVKSDFNKKGEKKLSLTYNEDNYELYSEFKSLGKAHSFKKNGKELNIGGGANIQQELIESYLDISPILLKILSCDLDICEMIPSKRKQILLSLNPVNIDIFTEYHKGIRKELNKVNNNISMLFSRKEKLKEQLIKKNELSELNKLKKSLEQEKINTTQWIIKIQTMLENKIEKESNIQFDKEKIDNLIRSFTRLNKRYSNIDNKINLVKIKLAQMNESLNNESINIDKLISRIEEYKTHLKHMTQTEKMELIDTNLKNTLLELKKLENINNNTGLHIDILKTLYENKDNILQQLIDWINDFREYKHSNILSISKLNAFKLKSEKIKNTIRLLSLDINSLNIKKNKMKEKSKSYTNLNVPEDCKKDICSLYIEYLSGREKFDDEYEHIIKKYKSIKKKMIKLEKVQIRYNREINNQDILHNKLSKLKSIFNTCPHLERLIKEKINIKKLLISEPLLLIKELRYIFSIIEKIIRKEKFLHIKDSLINELNSLKSSTKISSDFVKIRLKQDEDEYKKKYDLIQKLNIDKSKLEKKLIFYLEYKKILDNLNKEKDILNDILTTVEYRKKKEFLNLFLNDITTYFNQISDKLSTIKNTIKNQEFIIERLKNEVIIPLRNLTKDRYNLSLLEKGLREISLEYTKEFLDKLIKISNFFLSKIAAYPMTLNELSSNQIDFLFPITINDVDISDISKISSGQKDMIKISFNLALLIILNKLMYPLFIDEIDKALDETHKSRLLELFKYLISENIISQIFLVNHYIIFQEGFNGDVIVLNRDNIAIPEKYNENLTIKK